MDRTSASDTIAQENGRSQDDSTARKRTGIDLLNGPITKTMWAFSLPMMFSFGINMIYTWVDLYFVSRLGTDAIAALGQGDTLYFFIFTLMSGFATGTGIIVAHRIGEGNYTGAGETALQAVVSMGLLAFALAAVLLLITSEFLSLLTLPDRVLELTEIYITAIIFGVPFNFIFFQVSSILRSIGNTFFPMVVLIIAAVTNMVLDPLLIFGVASFPGMGILGAGISTAFAQFLAAALSLYALFSGKAGLDIKFRLPKPDFSIVGKITRLGVPATLQMISVSLSRIILYGLVGSFGASVAAAYYIGLKIDFFIFMPVFAMGVTIQTVTGQHLGANKPERIMEYYRSIILQPLLLIGGLGALSFLLAEPFARIFDTDPLVVNEAATYIRIAAFTYPFFHIGVISSRLIAGAGLSVKSMLIVAGSLLGIQVPLAYALVHLGGMDQLGIWLAIMGGYVCFAYIAWLNVRSKTWLASRV